MDGGVRDIQHDEEKSPILKTQHISNCPVCELCGTFDGLKICAACKDVWYCCKDHQRTHWSQHKTICKSSRNNPRGPNPTTTAGCGGQEGASVGGAASVKADPPQQTITNSGSGNADSQSLTALQCARAESGVHAGEHAHSTDTIVPTSSREVEEGEGGRGSADKRKAGSPAANHPTAAAETAAGQCSCSQSCSCTTDITGADTPSNPAPSGDMTQCKALSGAEGIAKVPSQASREKPISKSARRRARKASLASCNSSGSGSGSSLASSHSSSGSMSSHASSGSMGSSHASSGSLISRNTSSTSLGSSSSASSLVTFDLGPQAQAAAPTNTQTMPEPTSATKDLADYVVKYLTEYGICVIDKFLGEKQGNRIYDEVVGLHQRGIFQEGQLISPHGPKQKVRGDQITWVERGEPDKDQITFLISRLDSLMMACNERFRRNEVGGRTKAMVACYPGNGSYYLRHVDNPNEDGRLITCIYYLNKGWEAKRDGGVLRIFPESIKNTWVADIEPQFDRLLFFWSDRRNPHEVQAAYKQRFAITVWYFDKAERQQALSRYQSGDSKPGNARTMSTTLVSASSGRE